MTVLSTIRLGDLGISGPVDQATIALLACTIGSEKVISVLKGLSIFSNGFHFIPLNETRSTFPQNQQTHDSEVLEDTMGLLNFSQRWVVVVFIEVRTAGY